MAAETQTRPWCAGHHFPKAVYLPRLMYSIKLLCVSVPRCQCPKAHGPYESVPPEVSAPVCRLCRSVPLVVDPARARLDQRPVPSGQAKRPRAANERARAGRPGRSGQSLSADAARLRPRAGLVSRPGEARLGALHLADRVRSCHCPTLARTFAQGGLQDWHRVGPRRGDARWRQTDSLFTICLAAARA